MSTNTTAHTSERYREAVQAIIAADLAFWTTSLREARGRFSKESRTGRTPAQAPL